MTDKETKELSILKDEYRRCHEEMQELLNQNEKIGGIWLTMIVVAFGVGLKEQIHVIFFWIPVAIFVALFYTINSYEQIMIIGGYAATLETRINKIIGSPVLKWESQLSHKLTHFRLSTYIIIFLTVSASFGIVFYSLYDVFLHYSRVIFWTQIVFIVPSTLIVVWLITRLRGLHQQAQKVCQAFEDNE